MEQIYGWSERGQEVSLREEDVEERLGWRQMIGGSNSGRGKAK